MCGISGYITKKRIDHEAVLSAMNDAIKHRGPDSSGSWHDSQTGVGLSHVRLSILDLSHAGHQPMLSNRYVLTFNGEIYNHLELRDSLVGRSNSFVWKGGSDTETILACFEQFGLMETLGRVRGMFAIALFDRVERRLHLMRDRMGEKPLYYTRDNSSGLVFSSELPAIKKFPPFKAEVDPQSVAGLLRFKVIPGDSCIYKNVKKVPPGHVVTIDLDELRISSRKYWSLDEVITNGRENLIQGEANQVVDSLDTLLNTVISEQMIADVPLGAFLSGGVDSSTIVAIMQRHSSVPVKTFSIGFQEGNYNEADDARRVANHLGTDHHELIFTDKEALDLIPLVPQIYSEPFADASQLPTYLVSKFAREKVTVSMSGDAGDELFGGYNRYVLASRYWNKIDRIPLPLRKTLATSIRTLTPRNWDAIGKVLASTRLSDDPIPNFDHKVYKFADVLVSQGSMDLYQRLIKDTQDSYSYLDPRFRKLQVNDEGLDPRTDLRAIENMMRFDALNYLVDDILVKVDRAAMANSLETRIPFLDPRVIDFAWKTPLSFKLKQGKGKWVLRQVLNKYVPQSIYDKPKQGFGVPLNSWLRGPLSSWMCDVLDPDVLTRDGFFNSAEITKLRDAHLSGKKDNHNLLWSILMFQAWYKEVS